jgi:hypothetical protein
MSPTNFNNFLTPPSSPNSTLTPNAPPRPTRNVSLSISNSSTNRSLFESEQSTVHQDITYLFHPVPGHSYQEKLDELANCNCCDRHKINKPIIYAPWEEIITPPFNQESDINTCNCTCRHTARFICRQYPAVYTCDDN